MTALISSHLKKGEVTMPITVITDILSRVSDYYELPVSDIAGPSRKAEILVPRQLAIYLIRQKTDYTLAEVGQELNGRRPSTISHSYQKVARQLYLDGKSLRKAIKRIDK
jgi:chromosomal replication initiator protein